MTNAEIVARVERGVEAELDALLDHPLDVAYVRQLGAATPEADGSILIAVRLRPTDPSGKLARHKRRRSAP